MSVRLAGRDPPDWLSESVRRRMYLRARTGEMPAEALPQHVRHQLVADLVDAGWTDRDIAALTKMSEFVTARIRVLVGREANRAEGDPL